MKTCALFDFASIDDANGGCPYGVDGSIRVVCASRMESARLLKRKCVSDLTSSNEGIVLLERGV
jgi:hypothetical protein